MGYYVVWTGKIVTAVSEDLDASILLISVRIKVLLFLRNVGNHLPVLTTQHPISIKPSYVC